MGFVWGTKYNMKDADGHIVTSIDGYNSYLPIIDRATRYIWVFLTKNKIPQIKTVKTFLSIHGAKTTAQKYTRTDLGGELYGSHEFQQAVAEAGYRTVRDFYSPENFFAYVAWYKKVAKKIKSLKFDVGYIELCSQPVQLLTP
jgi:hypothetical protein